MNRIKEGAVFSAAVALNLAVGWGALASAASRLRSSINFQEGSAEVYPAVIPYPEVFGDLMRDMGEPKLYGARIFELATPDGYRVAYRWRPVPGDAWEFRTMALLVLGMSAVEPRKGIAAMM